MSELPRKENQPRNKGSQEENNPSSPLQDEAAASSPETRVFTVRLPVEIADWVDSEFYHGFKQNYILQCFLSLRYVMTEGELPPFSEYARLASLNALSELANPTR